MKKAGVRVGGRRAALRFRTDLLSLAQPLLARQGRVMALLRTTALALALGSANAGGAYPELSGGASYIKLTDATFDSFINDALAAGKTAMVRWIASEG